MGLNHKLTVGVLDDIQVSCYVYANQTAVRQGTSPYMDWNLETLLGFCATCEIDTLWITPGTGLSARAPGLLAEAEDKPELGIIASATREKQPRFALLWDRGQPGRARRVKLGFPEYDTRWPWWACQDSATLLRTILYAQDALDVELAWSPGHTGQQMMLESIPYDTWLSPAELPETIRKNLALDIQWKKQLHSEYLGMWIHLFDKNFAYGGAATNATMGEGSPIYQVGIPFDPRRPGLWRVGTRWLWTPELEWELTGVETREPIEEAWTWPLYHQTLRRWAERNWQARQALSGEVLQGDGPAYRNPEARALAYKTTKPVANQGMGWLAMESKGADNKLYRPDWWSMLVATLARVMRFKQRQLEQHGATVVYINVDTIGVLSGSPSMDQYNSLLLHRAGQLGGFKYVGKVFVTSDILKVFSRGATFRECQLAVLAALEPLPVGV